MPGGKAALLTRLVGLVGLVGMGTPALGEAPARDPCPTLLAQRPIASAPVPAADVPSATPANYRHRLRPTPLGWPRLDHWCVWIEPGASTGPAALWDGRWRQAIDAALKQWQGLLPVSLVSDPSRAQVRLLRRRPPLQHNRASHGRAELALVEVQRVQPEQPINTWQIEPQVTVQLSPGQGAQAMQATALHELGHAFGLWGHSDQPGDALAALPGSRPVLELSARDRATLIWLQSQPGLAYPAAVSPAAARPAAGPAPLAPGAN